MKIVYIVIFIVGFVQLAVADGAGKLSGKIKDANNNPVPFATVMIESSKEGASADASGVFTLSSPLKEKITLLVSSLGYNDKTVVVNVNEYSNRPLNITLTETTHDISEVVIRGNSKAAQIERSGFAVSSVDMKELATQSVELNEVLNQVPGMKVRSNGGLGSSTVYSINGLSGDAVRIFIDNVPIESFGSSYSLSSIPVSLIERVDVYKGVVPIELGNDALGGAINIVTKKQNYNSLSASYSFGSFNTHRVAVNGSMRNEKTGITAKTSIFYNYSDNNYKVWSDDVIITDDNMYLPDGSLNPNFGSIERGVEVERFHNSYESYGIKASVGVSDKSWVDQLFFTLNASSDYKETQHGATMLSVYGERFTEGFTVAPSLNYQKNDFFLKNLDVSGSFQYSYAEKSLVDTTSNNYNWYGEIRPIVVDPPLAGEGGEASLNIDENSNYIGRFSMAYNINKNNDLSFSYSSNNYIRQSDDAMSAPEVRSYGTTSEVHKQIVGLTAKNSAFDSRLKSSLFAKYYNNALAQDRVDLTSEGLDTIAMTTDYNTWGYGFTSAFDLSPKVQISASAEKAVRLVGADEVFGNVSNNIIASLDLKPETSNNVNLGTRISPLNSNYHTLNINANLFYRDTKDKIRAEPVVDADMDDMVHTNIGHVISKGIEFQANYKIGDKYDFNFQTYYLDSRFKEEYTPEGEIDLRYNSREPNVPFLTAGVNASRSWNNAFANGDRISVSWFTSYVHEFFLNWEIIGSQAKEMIPSQFINDMGVAYTFPNNALRVNFNAKNIFNEMAFDNYAIQKPGRAFYIKLSYQL